MRFSRMVIWGSMCLAACGTPDTDTDTDTDAGATVLGASDSPFGTPMATWFGEQKLIWLRGSPAGVCEKSDNGPMWFTHTGDTTCTIKVGEAVMIPMGFSVCGPCPELEEDKEAECAVSDPASQLTCVDETADDQERQLKVDGEKITIDEAFYIEPMNWELVPNPSGNTLMFVEAGSWDGTYPLEDVDCADPWLADNECGFDPGPRIGAVKGYAAVVRFDTAGKHEIVYKALESDYRMAVTVKVKE